MTEELKKALESAKTEEEKKAVVEKFKDEIQKLSDDELDKVAGGRKPSVTNRGAAPSLPANTIPAANGGAIYNQGDLTVWGGPWQ